ncbi:MAG: hypothetical protein KC422_01685 [Trueperaceae bacterium]|nr:hypothetical protein [Trueperaceae bacterium]
MRDRRYVAMHRGGPLSLEHHRLLALWAAACAEHVLSLFSSRCPMDNRPLEAIHAARAWAQGELSVGKAREASVAAHAAAREAHDRAATYVARAAGHAVATAHMADHSPGAAIYALKALRSKANFNESEISQEHDWQIAQLPEEIRDLVLSTFATKFPKLDL